MKLWNKFVMGALKKFVSKTHLDLVNMSSVYGFLYWKLFLIAGAFWVSVSTLLITLFGFFNKILFRYHKMDNSDCKSISLVLPQENNQIDPEAKPEEEKQDTVDFKDAVERDRSDEKESPKSFLKFQFQTYEEFSRSNRKQREGDPVISDSASFSSANKYEFQSEKKFSGFVVEPEVLSFTVKELYADSNNGSFSNKSIMDNGFLSEKDFSEAETDHDEEFPEKEVSEALNKDSPFGGEPKFDVDETEDVLFLSEKDFIVSDSDWDSITSSHEFSVMSRLIDSVSDGFLSDGDFGEEFQLKDISGEKLESTEGGLDLDLEELILKDLNIGHEHHDDDFDDEDIFIMDELRKIEETVMQESGNQDDNVESGGNDDKTKDDLEKSEKPNSDSEEPNGLETLWEHQDLIEQLKMELKKVRATGLPTILEDSECPKIMEDLKPWKIDEKFQHENPLGEIHKFYKSYRERMRKFDILNYQKMYAIGFLPSKDPLKSISSSKSTTPAFASLLSQNLKLGKHKSSEFDPMEKFIRELHSDLEMVYVGQLCLSWEFLHWQYEKTLELWESDTRGIRRYNEVAGEFQQFQVLVQRFIENEPFEGPRVQNYIKNRCVLRNLLQVPVMREDSLRDKNKARMRGAGDNAITTDVLVEIMEESIRIIWRFIRADKDLPSVILKCRKESRVELQDPEDLELLMEVRTNLQKKEKKLKDISRSGNCILKRFKNHQEDDSDHVLYFFSQVDMKLVSRVLNMSRVTTDQLLWCRNKLDKIRFANRKIHVEPSCLLFPC